MQEHIQFEFGFQSEYWDLPPKIDIFINNVLVWSGAVESKNARVLVNHTLDYNQEHLLAIRRYNKTDNQCVILNDGTCKDQYLIINKPYDNSRYYTGCYGIQRYSLYKST
jgi:hypothetical protein